jgi:hypothetical protein
MKISVTGFIIFVFFSFGKCNSSKPVNRPFINPQINYTYKPRSADGTGKFYANREIAQVMGSEGAAWLDRKDRQKEENSKLAIEKMN